MSYFRFAFASWLVGLALSVFVFLPARPAYATCGDHPGTENSQQLNTYRGVRVVYMKISNTNIPCVRVSSVIAFFNFDNYSEIGWYEDPTDLLTRCPATNGNPFLLVYSKVNANINCKQNPGQVSGTTGEFRTSDANGDTVWTYYYNSVYEGSYDLTFSYGQPITNGERKDLTGSMYSDFDLLQRWNASQGTWNNWTGTAEWSTPHVQDPDYEVCIYSNTHTSVELVC